MFYNKPNIVFLYENERKYYRSVKKLELFTAHLYVENLI